VKKLVLFLVILTMVRIIEEGIDSAGRKTTQRTIQNIGYDSIDDSILYSSMADDRNVGNGYLLAPLIRSPEVLPAAYRMKQSLTPEIFTTTGHASICSTMINQFATIIGAGMLGFPYAFANSGVVLGSLWFGIIALLEAYACHLLGKCVLKERKFSFRALATKTLKFQGNEFLVNLVVGVNSFGYACGYLIVCGQLFPDVVRYFFRMPEDMIWQDSICWISIVVTISLPMVCLKSLDALKFTSTLGLLGLTYVSIITAMFAYRSQMIGDPCDEKPGCPGQFHWGYPGDMTNLIRIGAIYTYSLTATPNVPTLSFELKNRSVRRLDIAMFGAILMVVAIYFITALAGYQALGDIVDANVLETLPLNTWTSVARLSVGIVLVTSFPLQMYVAKNAACNILYGLDAWECSNCRYYSTIFVMLAISWLIGVCIGDLSIILSLIGATTSMWTGFSFPAYFYIQLFSGKKGHALDMVMSYIILIMSLLLSPALVALEIYSIMYPSFK